MVDLASWIEVHKTFQLIGELRIKWLKCSIYEVASQGNVLTSNLNTQQCHLARGLKGWKYEWDLNLVVGLQPLLIFVLCVPES